ncbi:MAG: transglutaminase domain-containing protein, partial [Oscillospiraceae bacterium]
CISMKKFTVALALMISSLLVLASCASKTAQAPETASINVTVADTTTAATTPQTTPATTATAATTTPTSAVTMNSSATIITTAPITTPVTTTQKIVAVTAPPVTVPPLNIKTNVPLNTPAVPALQSKLTPITESYVYRQLPEGDRVIYKKLLTALKNYDTAISFSTPVPIEKITEMYAMIYKYENNMQYIADQYKYDKNPISQMELIYTVPLEKVNEIQAQTELKANEIISKITPTMSNFDIVKFFHDQIILNCTYDIEAEHSDMAYGALVKGRALCQGYAQAMSILCNKVGIDNTLVSGDTGEAHAWNMINLNGKWYHMDVTWDDGVELVMPGPGAISYEFFNVTEAEISDRTLFPESFVRPVATANDDNFFVHSGYLAKTKDEAVQIIYNQYIAAVNSGSGNIYLKCSSPELYKETFDYLFAQGGIFAIQSVVKSNATKTFSGDHLKYVKNDKMNTVQIYIRH